MKCEIYYFTGVGHSLFIARELAKELQGEWLPMISRIKEKKIQLDADVIGLVFPIYHATFGESGLPPLVAQFIEKLNHLEGKYIFAVGLHSGFPGYTMEKLSQRLASLGGTLGAGFTVLLNVPHKSTTKMRHAFFKQPLSFDLEDEKVERQKRLDEWHQRLPQYLEIIRNRQSIEIERPGTLKKMLLKPYLKLQKKMALVHYQEMTGATDDDFMRLTLLADCTFQVSEACTGCAMCAKVCPAQNIEMVHGKPQWQHHCENCTACFHWCPTHAISGDVVAYEKPIQAEGIILKDMLFQTAALR
ncbi:MAG: EFR1 family ferrodoxin [Anaerolineaceae bacterium]|nr:EFR1 family ferrodoxin [Anaerolineaceae bacterium]